MIDLIHKNNLIVNFIRFKSNTYLPKKDHLRTGLWLNWLKFFGFRQRIFRICMLLFFGRAAWHWIMRKIWEHTMLHWACITVRTMQHYRLMGQKCQWHGSDWKLIVCFDSQQKCNQISRKAVTTILEVGFKIQYMY